VSLPSLPLLPRFQSIREKLFFAFTIMLVLSEIRRTPGHQSERRDDYKVALSYMIEAFFAKESMKIKPNSMGGQSSEITHPQTLQL
jgi:hypothetical protein